LLVVKHMKHEPGRERLEHGAGPPLPLARALAALSVAGGLGLLLTPAALGAVFGLPRRVRLLRGLGVRDIVIGALGLAGHVRLSLGARSISDLGDAGLILREAGRRGRIGPVDAGRVGIALLSCTLACTTLRSARSSKPGV
jgi:hypothetical protein